MGLVIFFTALLSLADETCPQQKELPAMPVHDQDGLGTCASNTAALMMQHNLGLAESPSYFQLSLTYSGLKESNFFIKDSDNNDRVFNWGAHICDVLKSAKDNGYCDHSVFELDAVGRQDPTWEQQHFLENLSRFLNSNASGIEELKQNLSDSEFRSQARQRLASLFLERSRTCQESFPRFVARRGLERFKEWLTPKRTQGTLEEQVRYDRLWISTFNPDGTPQNQALEHYEYFLFVEGKNLLDSNGGISSLDPNLLPAERRFGEMYSSALSISGLNFDLPYTQMYQSDFDAYSVCRGNDFVSAGTLLLSQAPQCVDNSSESEINGFLSQADNILNNLMSYLNTDLDPQAGLVNLISPRCAVQMVNNKNNSAIRCENQAINNDSQADRAKNRITDHLCRDKAVAISMCTGFFKAEALIDSNYCKNDVPGVVNHGRHALTLIGYRTVGEKKQIKIQNSWGATCPFIQNAANAIPAGLLGSVECELDEEGSPTGRFWVDEDLLINNSYQLSFMP